MTENKPDLEVLPGGKDENTVEVELNDEEPVDNKELLDFYEDNRDAIDMMGGLEAFESLFALSEEQFAELKPTMLQMFAETLDDKQSERELMAMIISRNYDYEQILEETNSIVEAFDSINFLSENKKDLLKQFGLLLINKIKILTNHQNINIPCEVSEGVELPAYANEGDAGLDIYSPKEYTINPGETRIIPTGIKVAIPKGYAILIQPRSGQSVKTKLRIANTPGLIESGYRTGTKCYLY